MGCKLVSGFFARAAIAAFRHNGLVEAISKAFRELVKFIIPVNFDSFLGGIHHHMAFLAPMQMLVQLDFEVLADLAIEVIGQLF